MKKVLCTKCCSKLRVNEDTFTGGFALYLKAIRVMIWGSEQTEIKGVAVTMLIKIKQN